MDLLAKQRRALHDRNPLPSDAQQHIEGEPWRVFLNGIKVSKNLHTRLYEHCAGPALIEYWKSRRLGDLDHHHVHWAALAKAQQSLTWGHRCGKSKRISGFLGVGKNLHRWKQQSHSRCPRCGDGPEDMLHVLVCHKADEAWMETWTSTVDSWGGNNPSSYGVLDSIKLHLDNWRKSRPPPSLSLYHPCLQTALRAQSRIGWQNFLDGFLATEWEVVQANFYEQSESRRSTLCWLAGLIKQLWKASHAMWISRNLAQHPHSANDALSLESDMDTAITRHFRHGFLDLDSTRAAPLCRAGLPNLLARTFAAKYQWITNLVAARERSLREQGFTGTAAILSNDRQLMRRWMHLGRRNTARNPLQRIPRLPP
jgi:hypothetical protein